MLNQFVLVAKIKELPQVTETSKGIRKASMVVTAVRPFKNSDGQYDEDDFTVTLWRGIADECACASRIGAVVAIKGRMQSYSNEVKGTVYHNVELIAERVSMINNGM